MVITVQNLKKTYKIHKKSPGLRESIKSLFNRKYSFVEAVKGIDFTINGGEIVGLIGPNGSGKTTTLKMLSGLLHPTSGVIEVNSYLPFERKKEFLRDIGFVMGQKGQLWWDLPALDSYDLLIEIYNLNYKETMDYIYYLADKLNIKDNLEQPVRMLSLGQRMKAELIGAILHKPKILLLDEPTIGLDIYSARAIRKIIKEEALKREMIIILSSHILDDIQELCQRIIIINEGKLIYDDMLENCYQKYLFKKRIKAKFKKQVDLKKLSYQNEIIDYSSFTATWEVERKKIADISYEIMNNYEVDDITIAELSLSKVIEEITNGTDAR